MHGSIETQADLDKLREVSKVAGIIHFLSLITTFTTNSIGSHALGTCISFAAALAPSLFLVAPLRGTTSVPAQAYSGQCDEA